MRILALDVGEKRMGLAQTDELGVGVWPQATYHRRGLQEDLDFLVQKIEEAKIQILVVGLPYNMDGSEGSQAKKVRHFASELEKQFAQKKLSISIKWCDERLTSWEAEQRLTEKGLKGKKRKQQVDSMAACLILEDYLKGSS